MQQKANPLRWAGIGGCVGAVIGWVQLNHSWADAGIAINLSAIAAVALVGGLVGGVAGQIRNYYIR